ncbi:MAG TPA: phosphate acyltransferase, partial [Candidatus Kapabacteria bacterium]|nr:phosphate acyltransferase [Candidatus Kapabacteria bacterium]
MPIEMANVFEEIRRKAQATPKRIALGDATDARILEAARTAARERIAEIVLIGDDKSIERAATLAGIPLDGIEII